MRTAAALVFGKYKWTVLAGMAMGVLAALNQGVFELPTAAKTTITVVLSLVSALGIKPLLGAAFQAAVDLSPRVAAAISVGLASATVVVQQGVPNPWAAIIVGVANFAAVLGFTPAIIAAPSPGKRPQTQ